MLNNKDLKECTPVTQFPYIMGVTRGNHVLCTAIFYTPRGQEYEFVPKNISWSRLFAATIEVLSKYICTKKHRQFSSSRIPLPTSLIRFLNEEILELKKCRCRKGVEKEGTSQS